MAQDASNDALDVAVIIERYRGEGLANARYADIPIILQLLLGKQTTVGAITSALMGGDERKFRDAFPDVSAAHLVGRNGDFADALVSFDANMYRSLALDSHLRQFMLDALGVEPRHGRVKFDARGLEFLAAANCVDNAEPAALASQVDLEADIAVESSRCLAKLSTLNLYRAVEESADSTTVTEGITLTSFRLSEEAAAIAQEVRERITQQVKDINVSIDNTSATIQEQKSAHAQMKSHESHQQTYDEFSNQLDYQRRAVESLSGCATFILDAIETGVFQQKDAHLALLQELQDIPDQLAKLAHPIVNIAVCGPTSVGKTTFVQTIVGSRCLPTSIDPNTAIPVRITHDPAAAEPTLVLPKTLLLDLKRACGSIRNAVNDLRRLQVPHAIPKRSEVVDDVCQVYDALTDGDFDFDTAISQHTTGMDDVLRVVQLLTGIIRLTYHLRTSPRFAARLDGVDFERYLAALEASPQTQLPEITACCHGVGSVPLIGRLSFIDTPGVTEAGGKGQSVMNFATRATDVVFRNSSRIIVLTSPEQHASAASHELLRRVEHAAGTKNVISLVFNKFDMLDKNDQAAHFASYKQLYFDKGFRDVHWVVAQMAYNLVWGNKALQSIGIDAMRCNVAAAHSPADDYRDAAKYLVDMFGRQWMATLEDFFEEEGPQYEDKVWTRIRKRQARSQADSNVDHVITTCVLQSISRSLPGQCLQTVRYQISRVNDIRTRAMEYSIASVQARRELGQLVEAVTRRLEGMLPDMCQQWTAAMTASIENACFAYFVREEGRFTAELRKNVDSCINTYKDKQWERTTRDGVALWAYDEQTATAARNKSVSDLNSALQKMQQEIEAFWQLALANEFANVINLQCRSLLDVLGDAAERNTELRLLQQSVEECINQAKGQVTRSGQLQKPTITFSATVTTYWPGLFRYTRYCLAYDSHYETCCAKLRKAFAKAPDVSAIVSKALKQLWQSLNAKLCKLQDLKANLEHEHLSKAQQFAMQTLTDNIDAFLRDSTDLRYELQQVVAKQDV